MAVEKHYRTMADTTDNIGADIMAAQRQLDKTFAAMKRRESQRGRERRLLKDMQHRLLKHLPKEWNALNPEEHSTTPTLWEQLLAIDTVPYGLAATGWDKGAYNSPAAVALEAVATTFGLERAMETSSHAGIRVMADFVGVPYQMLLQAYIDKYGDTNDGKNYRTSNQ